MDAGVAVEGLGVSVGAPLAQAARGTTHWLVERWDADAVAWVRRKTGLVEPDAAVFRRLKVASYRTTEVVGNVITNGGWTRIMSLLTGGGGQVLDDTHTRIGVGDGDTSEDYANTNLAGGNKWWEPVTGVGTLGTRTLTFQASFGSSVANFDWDEFGIDVTSGTASAGNTVGALLFNRRAGIAQGTKANGQVWSASAVLTFT